LADSGKSAAGFARGLSATHAPSRSAVARSFANTIERLGKLGAHLGEITLDPSRPSDQDVIGAGEPLYWNKLTGKLTKAPLHSVADNRAADFPGDGETDAHGRILVLAIADEQDETGSGGAPPAVGGQEVRAFPNGG